MIRRLSLYEFLFASCCFLSPPVAFILSAGFLRAFHLIDPLSRDYLFLGLTLSLLWAVFSGHFGLTSVEVLFQPAFGWRNCLKATLWTYMAGFSALFFYRGATYSRLLFGLSAISLYVGMLLLRMLFRHLVRRSGEQQRLRVIIVGTGSFARRISERLSDSEVAPCETVAFVRIPGEPVAGDSEVPTFELDQFLRQNLKHFANEVVIAASPETLPILAYLIQQLKALAVPLRFCLDFGEDVKVRERFFQMGGMQLLDVEIAPSETFSYVVLKRCFDVVFSLLALAVAAIPMILIAIVVKLSSPGPVFFAQDRVGINGKVFRMLKFRTMQVAPASVTDMRWTSAEGDERRTFLGAFLRKSSLDELPQFFNVLRGEMSVVGPRPERPYFAQKFCDEIDAYNCRHHLKSGITGWAQVNGLRGDTDIAKRVEADMYYIENWSLAFDLRIIAMTLISGFFAENAY
jgi:Undecaprenyl-phosphate glucose phosphotransferase